MDVKIDQGIPPPPQRRLGFTALLRSMKAYESTLIDSPHAAALAYRVFGKGNYRSHKEHGGIRIWRLV